MRKLVSGIVFAAISSASAVARAVAPPAVPCASPEYHQLDFWVGKWDVYPTGKDKLVAHSLIESVYGCGIRENWMPLSQQPGGSLSVYVPAEKHWEQFWIDSSGSRAFFTRGWEGEARVVRRSPAVPTPSSSVASKVEKRSCCSAMLVAEARIRSLASIAASRIQSSSGRIVSVARMRRLAPASAHDTRQQGT